MKLTKKLVLSLVVIGILAVIVSAFMMAAVLAQKQPAMGIIGGADLPTMLLILSQRLPASAVWLFALGVLCLLASAVAGVTLIVSRKTTREE